MKPLFIPLKSEFFDAFKRGEKDTEYRRYGPRWNSDTCWIGRPVVLSKGYGKQHRLTGVVSEYRERHDAQSLPGWTSCYGKDAWVAACIKIKLTSGSAIADAGDDNVRNTRP